MIPFNKPYFTGQELSFIKQAVDSGKISGNGIFTKKCQSYFEENYSFQKCLLTQSCTDALEMAAILCNVQPGDEVIIPSFTFVSTANAFALRGAKIVFVDSESNHPNLDADRLECLITPRTKVIVPVHYAGNACKMPEIIELAEKHNLFVVEDAAQAFDSFHIDKSGNKTPLGSFGHLSTFSFHETKNIISGEGGMLVINDPHMADRAEIIWEKGTNRSAFFRGEVDKYGWVDIGSSFLPSEVTSAFLFAQLENSNEIQQRRIHIWNAYHERLKKWAITNNVKQNEVPLHSTNNAHMYYLIFDIQESRNRFIEKLKSKGVHTVFHYQSLHKSKFIGEGHNQCENSDRYSECLVRLPIYAGLTEVELEHIISSITEFQL